MSLVNDMLRDLEARRKKEGNRAVLSSSPSAVGRSRSGRLLIAALVGGGILLALAGSWGMTNGFTNWPGGGDTEIAQGEAAGQDELVKKPSHYPESINGQPVEKRAAGNEKLRGASESFVNSDREKSEEVEMRLQKLTVQEEDENAKLQLDFSGLPRYHLLQNSSETAGLIIAFSNALMAKSFRIQKVKGNVLTSLSFRRKDGRLEMLVGLAGRGVVKELAVVETAEGLSRLLVDVTVLKERQDEKSRKSFSPNLASEKNEENQAGEEAARDLPPAEHAVSAQETAVVSKKESIPDPVKQAYLDGVQQMREKRFAAAERSFKQVLALRRDYPGARLQLVEALIRQGKKTPAENLLQRVVERRPTDWQARKKLARLLAAKQHNQHAVAVLQESPFPRVTEDPEYYALFAALLQEEENYGAAAELYGSLLQLHPDKTVWWLGLAVSLDQLENYEKAQAAYERVLALPGLSPKLQQYAQSRLRVLRQP